MSGLGFFPGRLDPCVSTVVACVCKLRHDVFLHSVIGTEVSPGMHCVRSRRGKAGNSFLLLPSQRSPTMHGFKGLVMNVRIDNTPQKRSKARVGQSQNHRITESQNHRITEWLGLERTSLGHPVQPPAKAGSPRAGCTGPRPGGS